MKTNMRPLCPRNWLWILTALMLLTLIGPGLAMAKDGTLTYSWPSNVGDLNPHLYSPSQMFAQGMVYEPLVRYGQGGKIEPCLAERWEISDDGKTYTFHLRKGVSFSDGVPFDSAAVKKNWETVLTNQKRHDWLELVNQMERIETPDALTVRLTLKNAYYPALQEIALIRPVRFLSPAAFPPSGNTADGILKAAGTGPWILTETKKGEFDVFERNEKYWGVKPDIKRIVVKVIADPNTRLVALQSGEIDLIFGGGGHGGGQINLDAFMELKEQGKYQAFLSPPQASRVIALNSKSGPTAELAVRQALLHAVDKDALVRGIFLNAEKRADTLFSPTTPYCDLGLAAYSHDKQKAATLLEDAGWKLAPGKEYRSKDSHELLLDLCFVGTDPLQKSIAEFLQADLKKVGVKANLIGEEEDSIGERQKNGAFHMVFGDTWGAPYDPHSFVSSMRVPTHADYQAQLGLPMKSEIDKQIGEVLICTDPAKRQELYRSVLTTLHKQAVYLPLTYQSSMVVHSSAVDKVGFSAVDTEIPFAEMVKK